jgi:hypothetical protein
MARYAAPVDTVAARLSMDEQAALRKNGTLRTGSSTRSRRSAKQAAGHGDDAGESKPT